MPEELKAGNNSLYKKQLFNTLKNNKDFEVMYKKGYRLHCNGFIIFFLPSHVYQIGFTASKKIGNSVKRNRCKRVLRSMFYYLFMTDKELPKGSYVFVAKVALLNISFQSLLKVYKYQIKELKKIAINNKIK